MSENPVVTRRLADGDLPQVAALLDTAVPGHAKGRLDVLRWHYGRDAFGAPAAIVATVGEQIVGHYGLVRVPVRVDGHEVTGALTGNLGVHPHHRGRGIARRLVGELHQLALDDGLALLVSYTNDDSRAILESSGWGHIGDPRLFAMTVPGAAWARRPDWLWRTGSAIGHLPSWRPARGSKGLNHELGRELPDDLDRVDAWDSVSNGVVRSAGWLRWRYEGHPDHPYRVVVVRRGEDLVGLGVCSIRTGDGRHGLQLLELLGQSIDACSAVLRAAADLARHEEAPLVVAATMPASLASRVLRAAGLLPIPRRVQPRPIHLLGADLTGSRPDLATRRWSFSLGDQDHL